MPHLVYLIDAEPSAVELGRGHGATAFVQSRILQQEILQPGRGRRILHVRSDDNHVCGHGQSEQAGATRSCDIYDE